MTTLSGKTVVLTGASRGIGKEISQLLAQQGMNLIGIARSAAALERWAADMSQFDIRAEGIAFDLADTTQLPLLLQQIEQVLPSLPNPQIDVLINNAGIEIYRAFEDYHPAEIERVIRVNLIAAMQLTQMAFPHFSTQGHIVNMASLAAKQGHPFDSAYAASKAGLLLWSHSLRQELADTQMSVSAICPGYVSDCGMLADTGIDAPWLAGRSRSDQVAAAVLKAIYTRPAEVVVNRDWVTGRLSQLLAALEQCFPRLADFSNRWMGVTERNRQRAGKGSLNQATSCIGPHPKSFSPREKDFESGPLLPKGEGAGG